MNINEKVKKYISDNWQGTIRNVKDDVDTLIGMPYPYSVSGFGDVFQEMYYWGTYFTNTGLILAGRVEQAKNNVNNMIYLIDRLGRYVSGFPVDLKKEILIGPDVYDFNGTKKYNIMVLHKDNTLEMYNMKGEKPSSWKGIRAEETIKSLPERISVGGSSFWVVRTSVQTLIYPFYGGEPLTKFSGDQMIRPDSEIKVVDGTTVETVCYDGKRRTVKVK